MTKLLLLIASIFSLLILNSFEPDLEKKILSSFPSPSATTSIAITETKATTTKPQAESVLPNKTVPQKTLVQKTSVTAQIENPLPTAEVRPTTKVIEFENINNQTRSALVNVLCTTDGNTLSPLSGSGVVISEKGIILTNAHIGQYFLLPQYVDCVIRTGSPAYPLYKAKILYISSTWIDQNAHQIQDTNPMGTGENDYALLLITERIASTDPLPNFNSMNLFLGNVSEGEYMLAASYPAGFLGGSAILQNLYAVSSVTNVKEVFTFKENTVDLFSIGGTIVSQKGSSGGAAVNKDGLLGGLIVTATIAEQTSDRDLRAITIDHINRSLISETGRSLQELLQSDPRTELKKFENEQFPAHKQKLIDILKN